MKYLLKYGRQRNLIAYFFDYATLFKTKRQQRKRRNGCIFPFTRKGDFGITKNYNSITLTAIAANVYNTLLLNFMQSEAEKVIRKNQTTSQILIIRQIIERLSVKISR